MKEVIIKLDEVLKDRGVTAYRLSKNTGISANALSKIINNKTESIKFEVIEKICDALQVDISDILVLVEVD